MNNPSNEELMAVFEEAQEELPKQIFHASVMDKIEQQQKLNRIKDLLYVSFIIAFLFVLFLLFGNKLESTAIQSMNRLVEGPWLLTIMVVAISLCLMPFKEMARQKRPS